MVTRAELSILSQAQFVAFFAMAVPETRNLAPLKAAQALHEAASVDLPGFAPACHRFLEHLRASRGRPMEVRSAGQALQGAVAQAMAFVPCDAGRVDIHG